MGLHSLPIPGRIAASPFEEAEVHTHTHIPLVVLAFPCSEGWKPDIFKDIMYLDVSETHSERAVLWSNLHCLIGSKIVQTRSPGAVALFGLHCWYQEGAKWGPHLGTSPTSMAAMGDKSSDGWGKAQFSTPNSDCSQMIPNPRLPHFIRSSLLHCI